MKFGLIIISALVFLTGCSEAVEFDAGTYSCNDEAQVRFWEDGRGDIQQKRGSPLMFYYELDGNKIVMWDRHAKSGSGKMTADRDEFDDNKLDLFSIENGALVGVGEIGEKFGTCKEKVTQS